MKNEHSSVHVFEYLFKQRLTLNFLCTKSRVVRQWDSKLNVNVGLDLKEFIIQLRHKTFREEEGKTEGEEGNKIFKRDIRVVVPPGI